MILVGVDVASEKHDVSIIRDTGEVIRDNFTVPNKESGYKKLLDEIEKAEKLYPDDKVRIGLESTGVYSIVNAKVNMYKTANVKMYCGVHVFSFHSSWNEKKTAPYNVSERRMRHEGVNTSRINNF